MNNSTAQLELPFGKSKAMFGSFEMYDESHPDIWQRFESMAWSLIRKGFKHYSAKALFETIRFHTAIEGGIDFKLNNTYTADYARKFIKKYPEYKDFFETREKHTN